MTEDNHVTLRLPTPLRPYVGQQATVEIGGATVGQAVANLVLQYPALRRHLLDGDGSLRKFVHLYLNGEDIYEREGVETPLAPGDKLTIIPAIAGGCPSLQTQETLSLPRSERRLRATEAISTWPLGDCFAANDGGYQKLSSF